MQVAAHRLPRLRMPAPDHAAARLVEAERALTVCRSRIAKLQAENAVLRAGTPVVVDLSLSRGRKSKAAILAAVAVESGLSIEVLRGRDRRGHISAPRQHAMRLMQDAGWSTPEIARFLDGRDHTTILHGIASDRARDQHRGVSE
ncbi:MAG: helix-turn-helix domain-containing protein [Pseudomonadota bacterium]